MQSIVFLDRATLASQIRLRRPRFEHEWVEHDRTSPEQALERLQGTTIAITNMAPIDAATLEGLP